MMQQLNLLGFIFGLFVLFLISCEQSELTTIEKAPVQELGLQKVESASTAVEETTPVVEYPLVMQPYNGSDKNTLRLIGGTEKDRGSTKPRTRAGQNNASNGAAKSSCYSQYVLGCNVSQLRSSTEEDVRSYLPETQDANDADFYEDMGFNIALSGNEKAFYIEVTRETYYQITISGHQRQLAMILLETDFESLGCFEENQNIFTTEAYSKVAAYRNVTAGRTTTLGPVRLTPGFYTLVIDSYRGGGTSFFISTKCTTYSTSSCGNGTIVFDDFSKYTAGIGIAEQSSYWEKWNPEATYDGIVYYCSTCTTPETQRFTRTLSIARQPTNSSSQPNVLLSLGERFDGRYELKFELGVRAGKSGFFSLQNVLTNGNEFNEEGAKFYFRDYGYGEVKIAGRTIPFNYKNGYWQEVKLDFDFNNNTVKFYLHGTFIGQWETTDEFNSEFGSGQVEGLQFYPYYSNSDYLIEGVCFRAY